MDCLKKNDSQDLGTTKNWRTQMDLSILNGMAQEIKQTHFQVLARLDLSFGKKLLAKKNQETNTTKFSRVVNLPKSNKFLNYSTLNQDF